MKGLALDRSMSNSFIITDPRHSIAMQMLVDGVTYRCWGEELSINKV